MPPCILPLQRGDAQELLHGGRQGRQHRLEIEGQVAEKGERGRADRVQRNGLRPVLRELPRLALVDVLIGEVGELHDLAQRLAELARFVVLPDPVRGRRERGFELGAEFRCGELAVEPLADEARAAAGDVHVFADEVRVHPRDEVVGVEVDVLDRRVQLGGDVVAQPLRVHPELEVLERAHPGAARLGHLLAGEGDEAVHVHVVRDAVERAGELEHRRPEQGVEVDDVLADEVDLLGVAGGEELLEGPALAVLLRLPGVEVVLERGEIADRRVEPDVEVLARRVRDRDAEVGLVARDVPVGEGLVALALEPFPRLVGDLRLEPAVLRPRLQERDALRVGELEEVVLGGLQHRRRAGERRVRVLQVGRRVDAAAVLARVAVLVLGAADRTLALDVAIGEEHPLHRVVELLDRARVDEPGGLQPPVHVLRQRDVLRRVGRVPVVERDVEAFEVARPLGGDAGNKRLRGDALFLGLQHDRRAVGVVGADEMHRVPLHPLEAHPDVGLDVLHDVADVERAVRVRQGGGDEEAAGHRRKFS